MKLYVNVVPFKFGYVDEFIEVGTTFAAVGADTAGLALRLAEKIDKENSPDGDIYIHPEILNHAFKPVMEV